MAKIVEIGRQKIDISLKQAEAEIIKGRTPVLTGTLQAGFIPTADGDIINDTPYGVFVELGTGQYYKGELGPPLHPGWPCGFAGRYMVTRSEEDIVNSILKRALADLDVRQMLHLPDEIMIDFSGDIYLKAAQEGRVGAKREFITY